MTEPLRPARYINANEDKKSPKYVEPRTMLARYIIMDFSLRTSKFGKKSYTTSCLKSDEK